MGYKLTQLVHEAREKEGKAELPSVIEVDIVVSEQGEKPVVEKTFHFKPIMRLGKKAMKKALKAAKDLSGDTSDVDVDDLSNIMDSACALLIQLLPEKERKDFDKIDLDLSEILAIQQVVLGDTLGKSSDSVES